MLKMQIIDTLYLYGTDDIQEDFFYNQVEHGDFSFLSVAAGYTFFKNEKNGDRVGVCSADYAKKINSYPVIYQYSKENCHSQNFSTYSRYISLNACRVKRVDYAVTFMCSFNPLSYSSISPFRSQYVISSPMSGIETVYLGSRKTGKVFRAYNKTKELDDTQNFKGIEHYGTYFNTYKNLYTFELELHRKYLVNRFGDITFASLNNVEEFAYDIISSVIFFPHTDQNISLYKNRHYDCIQDKFILDLEERFYVTAYKKSNDKPSFDFLRDRIYKIIENYLKVAEIDNLDFFYMSLFNSISAKDISQDLEFIIEPSLLSKDIKKLRKKIDNERNGQTNELYLEAKKAFEIN